MRHTCLSLFPLLVQPPYLSQFAVYKTLLENTFRLKDAKTSNASVFYPTLESQKCLKKKKAAVHVVGALRLHKSKREKSGLFLWGWWHGVGHLVVVIVWQKDKFRTNKDPLCPKGHYYYSHLLILLYFGSLERGFYCEKKSRLPVTSSMLFGI